MKRNGWTLVALTTLVFLCPLIARAGVIYHSGGLEAFASTYAYDGSGCIEAYVYVDAVNGKGQQPPGPPAQGAFLYAGISVYNYCTGESSYLNGSATLAGSDFQIDRQLDDAQLATTASLYGTHCSAPDENGQVTCNEVQSDWTFNVSWQGISAPSRERFVETYHNPKCNETYRTSGKIRQAAVSGSVSDGTNTYALADEAAGVIVSARYSTLIVGCSNF